MTGTNMLLWRVGPLLSAALIMASAPTWAATPLGTAFTYQGRLLHNGSPVNSSADLRFILYGGAESGGLIGPPVTVSDVSIANGLFTASVDFGSDAFNGEARWLGVEVRVPHDPTGMQEFIKLTPRQPLTAVPYALQTRGMFVDTAGKVGIGTTAPQNVLHVQANSENPILLVKNTSAMLRNALQAESTGHAIVAFGGLTGVRGEASLTGGAGVSGYASGGLSTYAVRGDNASSGGYGVYGRALAESGTNYGVYGETRSPQGWAGFFVGRCFITDKLGLGTVPTFQLHLATNSAAKPTSNTWTIASDRRLKKNIRTIGDALARLLRLRGVTYQWKDPASQGSMTGTYTGLIAQEVEEVFPEWISEDRSGCKHLTVIGFEGLVVEALRDLRKEKDAQIATLQARHRAEIDALRAEKDRQIAELIARIERLEQRTADPQVAAAR